MNLTLTIPLLFLPVSPVIHEVDFTIVNKIYSVERKPDAFGRPYLIPEAKYYFSFYQVEVLPTAPHFLIIHKGWTHGTHLKFVGKCDNGYMLEFPDRRPIYTELLIFISSPFNYEQNMRRMCLYLPFAIHYRN